MSAHPQSSPAPKELKGYTLKKHLARGGSADIYLATRRGMAGVTRQFVLKLLLPELAGDEEFAQMFVDEARIAASMHHANIVQVHDFDCDSGVVFMSMEYLQGRTLGELLKQSEADPVPPALAVAIAMGVLEGLHYAHELAGQSGAPLGIVHRDVSPRNVFVTDDGIVKVIDFGIALSKKRITKTRHGLLRGTIGYMSPEQCRCEPLDRRSDIFCVGILLYEMCTGRRLFAGENEYQVIKSIVEEDVPPLASDVCPPRLAAIIEKCLCRDRDERYATAEEVRRELQAAAREQNLAFSQYKLSDHMRGLFDAPAASEARTVHDKPSARRPRRRWFWIAPLVAVLALAGWFAAENMAAPEDARDAAREASRSPDPAAAPPGDPADAAPAAVPAPLGPADAGPPVRASTDAGVRKKRRKPRRPRRPLRDQPSEDVDLDSPLPR